MNYPEKAEPLNYVAAQTDSGGTTLGLRDRAQAASLARKLGLGLCIVGLVMFFWSCIIFATPRGNSGGAMLLAFLVALGLYLIPGTVLGCVMPSLLLGGLRPLIIVLVVCTWLLIGLGLDLLGSLLFFWQGLYGTEPLTRVVADGLTLLGVVKLSYHVIRAIYFGKVPQDLHTHVRARAAVDELKSPPTYKSTSLATAFTTIALNLILAATAIWVWIQSVRPTEAARLELQNARDQVITVAINPYSPTDFYRPQGLPKIDRDAAIAQLAKDGVDKSRLPDINSILREDGKRLIGPLANAVWKSQAHNFNSRVIELPHGRIVFSDKNSSFLACIFQSGFILERDAWHLGQGIVEDEMMRLIEKIGRPIDTRQAKVLIDFLESQRFPYNYKSFDKTSFFNDPKLRTDNFLELKMGNRDVWIAPDGRVFFEALDKKLAAIESQHANGDFPRQLDVNPLPAALLLVSSFIGIASGAVLLRSCKKESELMDKDTSRYATITLLWWFTSFVTGAWLVASLLDNVPAARHNIFHSTTVTLALVFLVLWIELGIKGPLAALKHVKKKRGSATPAPQRD